MNEVVNFSVDEHTIGQPPETRLARQSAAVLSAYWQDQDFMAKVPQTFYQTFRVRRLASLVPKPTEVVDNPHPMSPPCRHSRVAHLSC